jgi:hypothetical protein
MITAIGSEGTEIATLNGCLLMQTIFDGMTAINRAQESMSKRDQYNYIVARPVALYFSFNPVLILC